MLMTFPNGQTIPVNYLREGDKIFVGADGAWWREFRDGGASVTLLIPSWLPYLLNGKLAVITLDSPA